MSTPKPKPTPPPSPSNLEKPKTPFQTLTTPPPKRAPSLRARKRARNAVLVIGVVVLVFVLNELRCVWDGCLGRAGMYGGGRFVGGGAVVAGLGLAGGGEVGGRGDMQVKMGEGVLVDGGSWEKEGKKGENGRGRWVGEEARERAVKEQIRKQSSTSIPAPTMEEHGVDDERGIVALANNEYLPLIQAAVPMMPSPDTGILASTIPPAKDLTTSKADPSPTF